jgi:hypothetical protein
MVTHYRGIYKNFSLTFGHRESFRRRGWCVTPVTVNGSRTVWKVAADRHVGVRVQRPSRSKQDRVIGYPVYREMRTGPHRLLSVGRKCITRTFAIASQRRSALTDTQPSLYPVRLSVHLAASGRPVSEILKTRLGPDEGNVLHRQAATVDHHHCRGMRDVR